MAFHIIPNVCGLKWNERLVLDALCYFANNDTKECYPSQATIAEWCDIDRKKVIEGVKGLVEKGIVKTKKTTTTLIYTITIDLCTKVSNPENGTTKKSCSENGTACCSENGTQTRLIELEKNLRTKNEKRTKQPTEQDNPKSKTHSLTVQVENELIKEYKKLEELNNKVVQPSIAIQRKLIKNSLTFFDNDLDWIKVYIKRALQDKYVVSQCYSATALFSRITIQKYLRDTKPVKYSEPAPVYELSDTDKMVAAMTPDERKKWIRDEMRRARERRTK